MHDTIDAPSPFHVGELSAQRLAGVAAPRPLGIRPFMPDQHRDFFALLPYVLIAARDGTGWSVPTMLAGFPGFISSPDPTTLRMDTMADPGDPVRSLLTAGAEFGLLGIDLSTRRRNRANGRVIAASERALTLGIEQSFGNCPQYINLRDATWHDEVTPSTQPFVGLDEQARALIRRADTFFVASGSQSGLDISHRGGPSGFVSIEGGALVVPDYRGNRFFNTLGNLLLDPRASLLFVDFERGDTLVVRGRVEIDWPQRVWRLTVEDGWRREGALPLRWREKAT
jgi:predicted pyridoxine 5'-phosphate oxidase superfamily flavin-nucleotide-binding protein